jgi:hypothetical protein
MASPPVTSRRPPLLKRGSSKRLVPDPRQAEAWTCFCCTKRNIPSADKCCVCGRGKDYIIKRGTLIETFLFVNMGPHRGICHLSDPLPLHGEGAAYYRKEQLKSLYPSPLDVEETDDQQWNALHYVAAIGNKDLLSDLIELGGSVTTANAQGMTPLHLAVQSGQVHSVSLCLTSGADINQPTSFELNTPLHMAVGAGMKNMTMFLVDAGAKVNVANAIGRTPFHLAAALGRTDLGAYLLRHGADHRAFDYHGWNARQIAEYNGYREFEELVVRCDLTVHQSVIKELPPGDWQSSVWTDVTSTYQRKREEYLKREAAYSKENERHAVPSAPSAPSSPKSIDAPYRVGGGQATLKQMAAADPAMLAVVKTKASKAVTLNLDTRPSQAQLATAANVLNTPSRSILKRPAEEHSVASSVTFDFK